jgi:hypothetical protein
VPFEEVVRNADAAMFDAKHQGRDRVCVFAAARPVVPEQRRPEQGAPTPTGTGTK